MGGQRGVGVYIGSDRIHVLELSRQMGRTGLVGYGEADLPVMQADQETLQPESRKAVIEALRQAMQKAGVEPGPVAAALPGKDAVSRYFEIPLLPKKDWPTAVRFEAQKYMTLNTEDLYFNFEVFPNKADKTMKIVFLASPKETVSRIVTLYFDAGLNLRSLEPVSLSILRAFAHERQLKPDEAHAIIDTRNDGKINILIVKGPMLLMARDSVILKSPEGDPEAPRRPDFKALMTEVNLSFNYFLKHFKDDEIKSVFLLAESADAYKDWDRRLAAELGIPVETSALNSLFGSAKGYSAGRTVALGLALREASAFENRQSNLIPAEIAKTARKVLESQAAIKAQRGGQEPGVALEDQKGLLLKWAAAEAGLAVLCLAAIFGYLIFSVSSQETRLKAMRRAAPATLSVMDPEAAPESLKTTLSLLDARELYLSSLIDKRGYWTSRMAGIARAVPSDVQLLQIMYDDAVDRTGRGSPTLRFTGRGFPGDLSNPLEPVNRFTENLRKSSTFMKDLKEVRIISIRRSADTVEFAVDCLSPLQGGA